MGSLSDLVMSQYYNKKKNTNSGSNNLHDVVMSQYHPKAAPVRPALPSAAPFNPVGKMQSDLSSQIIVAPKAPVVAPEVHTIAATPRRVEPFGFTAAVKKSTSFNPVTIAKPVVPRLPTSSIRNETAEEKAQPAIDAPVSPLVGLKSLGNLASKVPKVLAGLPDRVKSELYYWQHPNQIMPAAKAGEQKAMQTLVSNLPTDPIGAGAVQALNSATLGGIGAYGKLWGSDAWNNYIRKMQQEHPVASTIGDFAGYAMPGSGADKLVAAAAKPALEKLGESAAAKIAGKAITGAVSQGAVSALGDTIQGNTPANVLKDAAKNAAVGATLGAAGEAIPPLLAKSIGKAKSVLNKGVNKIIENGRLAKLADAAPEAVEAVEPKVNEGAVPNAAQSTTDAASTVTAAKPEMQSSAMSAAPSEVENLKPSTSAENPDDIFTEPNVLTDSQTVMVDSMYKNPEQIDFYRNSLKNDLDSVENDIVEARNNLADYIHDYGENHAAEGKGVLSLPQNNEYGTPQYYRVSTNDSWYSDLNPKGSYISKESALNLADEILKNPKYAGEAYPSELQDEIEYYNEWKPFYDKFFGKGEVKNVQKLSDGSYEINYLPQGTGAMSQTKTGALVEKYDAMEPGENPTGDNRMVYMPAKTGAETPVRAFARTAAESQNLTDDMAAGIEKDVTDGNFSYQIMHNKKAKKYADSVIENNGFTGAMQQWNGLVASGKVGSKNDIVLGEKLLVEAAKRGDADTVSKMVADVAIEGTKSGQKVQALSMLKRMTPQGKLYYIQRLINVKNAELTERLGDKFKPISLSPELSLQLMQATTQKQMEDVEYKIMLDIAKQVPSTWQDKFDAWRYTAMLFNPKTHIRNILGNVAMDLMRREKNLFGAGFEKFIPKEERTKAIILKTDPEVKRFVSAAYENVQRELKANGKMDLDSILEQNKKVFGFKPAEAVRKLSFNSLDFEDGLFKKTAFEDSLAQAIKARGLTVKYLENGTAPAQKALSDIVDYAKEEALKATFNDANHIASAISRIENFGSNNALAKAGKKLFFGGLLPFKKTPMNIIKRGAAYSPVGLLKTLSWDTHLLHSGQITGAKFIDNLAEGLSGTSVALLGGWLAAMGLVNSESDLSSKASTYMQQLGAQDYSVKLGDKTYTIDWITPTSMPFFVGVELYNSMFNHAAKQPLQGISRFADAMTKVSDPVFNLSMLSGINSTIKSAAYAAQNGSNAIPEVLSNIASGYASQFVPTGLGQVARTITPVQRSTQVMNNNSIPKSLAQTVAKMQAKTPGANLLLQPKVDLWGREASDGNLAQRALTNFVSPGYLEGGNQTSVDKEITRLYGATDSSVLPSAPKTYVEYKGQKYTLTPPEYTRLSKTQGQEAYQGVSDLMNSGYYWNESDDEKKKEVAKVYKQAAADAKKEFLEARGIEVDY